MKKIRISSEAVYLIANVILALAVAMVTAADFGVSMIVAPAYILHRFSEGGVLPLTFGQAEYVVQGLVFVLFCILMRRFKPLYLVSFGTGLFYGAILDLWRAVLPHFNPAITPAGSLPLEWNILYFTIGELLTSLSIAMFFRTYIYAQVYDFFVKGITERYNLPQTKFKMAFDAIFLLLGVLLSWIFFGTIFGYGIGVGTLILTVINGALIGFFGKLLDRFFLIEPAFSKLAKHFD
ncbi:MAG: hypothetical protein IJC17_05195 [Clostridia bacterium]|nr:hypothetical protein [Clostridia bacterium]